MPQDGLQSGERIVGRRFSCGGSPRAVGKSYAATRAMDAKGTALPELRCLSAGESLLRYRFAA